MSINWYHWQCQQKVKSMCSLMNDYFSSLFTIEDRNVNLPIVDQLFTGGQPNMLSDINITKELVSEKLNHLNPIRQVVLMILGRAYSRV